MKKLILFFASLGICLTLLCQEKSVVVKELTPDLLPKKVIYPGNFIEAKKWKDNNGEQILIISRLGPYQTRVTHPFVEVASNAVLFCSQYLINGPKINLLWQYSDSVLKCNVDMYIGILPGSTSVTDLDKNGITETTVIYRKSCRGDVSPSDMFVQIFEGKKLYKLSGQMYSRDASEKIDDNFQFDLSKTELDKLAKNSFEHFKGQIGRYINEKDFSNAPEEFLTYARKKWREFCTQDNFETLK